MANFDENNQQSICSFVLDNLRSHNLMALGTQDENGNPWVVCVNLTVDNNGNIIWKSLKNTEHSKHIQKNPHVSICVFSKEDEAGDFGFYSYAEAHEVTDEAELQTCIDARYTQKGLKAPSTSEFLEDAPASLYIAHIEKAWVNDDRHVKTPIDMEVYREVAQM